MFICEFCKIFEEHLLTEQLRMAASCVYLWILRSFSDHLFYRAPLGNCLFLLQVSFKSSYSKAFMYLKSLKIICEEVNL